MKPTPLCIGQVAILASLSLALCTQPSLAKPRYGAKVDEYCASHGRTPATPYADDCSICHDSANYRDNRTPGFRAYKDDDFDYFCPPDQPNQPPMLDPIGDQRVDESGLLDLTIVARDPDGSALRIEASDVPTGAMFHDNGFGTATFVWMPGFDSAGNYPVLFKVTDMGTPPASNSEGILITVGNVNRPPVLEPVGSQSVAQGDRLTFVLRASDPDRDPVRFGAAGLPASATFLDYGNGSAEFSWLTGPGDTGNSFVTFTATDAGIPMQSDSEEVVITVGTANRPPQLAPIGNQQAQPLAPLLLMITASDPDGDEVFLAVDSLPDGASFEDAGDGSAQLAWTPRVDQSGNYAIRCTATDDGVPSESATEAFTISVGDVNRPPILDPLVLIEEGPVLVIPLTARDPDGDDLVFKAVGVPLGASFLDHRDRTAEFRWEPAAELAGEFSLTFVVTDDGVPQESTSATTTISVEAEPPAGIAAPIAAPTGNGKSNWACGLGFELVFVLLPLMQVQRKRARGA